MRSIVKPSDPSILALWIVCLVCLFFPMNEVTAQDGIDPAIREYGILYTVDGRKLWGRLVSFDGQTYKWQLPNEGVLTLPRRQVTTVLPIPLGVVPQSYVFRGEERPSFLLANFLGPTRLLDSPRSGHASPYLATIPVSRSAHLTISEMVTERMLCWVMVGGLSWHSPTTR